ncbi:response regulator transcription factor [Alkalihalobacillus sp. 1P02AB]|uniref:response regulator transcription factor n=1 Tax=Alkalihalobacillus sp. 1P02AB TaxID=3132260 RepID=UPI0039A72970
MFQLLIADDEYDIRMGLSTYFPWENIGFEVAGAAANGKEALSILSEKKVDVLLCDIRMPEISGLDLAKELRKNKPELIIIFLSGYKEFEYAQKAMEYGVRRFLLKPTKQAELLETFKEVKKDLDKNNQFAIIESLLPEDLLPYIKQTPNKTIQLINEYVHQSFGEASLDAAAEQAGMSATYLSTFFKEKTGINFSDYLTHIRMKKALELLQDPTFKMYEISHLVGYSNPKNFTRKFNQYFGKSPREIKELL